MAKKTEDKAKKTEMTSPDGTVWEMFVTDKGVLNISKKEK